MPTACISLTQTLGASAVSALTAAVLAGLLIFALVDCQRNREGMRNG